MNLVGMAVTHVKYGKGNIAEINDNKMKVEFKDSSKMFLYPDAFGGYFVLGNKKAQDYIDNELDVIKTQQQEETLQQGKRTLANAHARKQKGKSDLQAVFALEDNTLEDIMNHGTVFTGYNISGKSKGQPRIPKNMNVDSACIFTAKSHKEEEKERSIIGLFMTSEDFIGEKCSTGMISLHPQYRILWNEDHEKLLFWDYLPQELRLKKWGSSEVKYLPGYVVKTILEDMLKIADGETEHEEIQNFYHYFCQMNQ